ncbi:MAG: hypothetical protein AB7H97_06335 [Pseudobdellovibrionaceae bacterium]
MTSRKNPKDGKFVIISEKDPVIINGEVYFPLRKFISKYTYQGRFTSWQVEIGPFELNYFSNNGIEVIQL